MQPQYIVRQRAYARIRLLQDAKRLGNISRACRRHGVSRTYYYKWRARYDGTLESLWDRSRRPRGHPRQLSAQEHALVKRVAQRHPRWGLYRLHFILRSAHGFTRSIGGLYKALKRLGFYAPARRPRRRKYKRYERPWPGANIQIDVKYLPKLGGQQDYQYTALDEYSRLRYARIYSENTPRQAREFLGEALDFFQHHHIRVAQVQTDHGTEFTYAMFPHVHKEHPFERHLRQAGIRHKLTPIGQPHLQGKVERSHRIDDDEFYHVYSFADRDQRRLGFQLYLDYYNTCRAHGSLNWRTPTQHLQAWHQSQSVNHA